MEGSEGSSGVGSHVALMRCTGLLPKALNIARGSLVGPEPLGCRICMGPKVGEPNGRSDRGYALLRGEEVAAWRRREDVLCLEVNLGEGKEGRGGLEEGEGLYMGRS